MSLKISFQNAGKKYYREWIFRHFNHSFSNDKVAILGPNGSGKSTLLQVVSGAILLNEGSMTVTQNDITVEPENLFSEVVIAAPYLELIEEFTLGEIVS